MFTAQIQAEQKTKMFRRIVQIQVAAPALRNQTTTNPQPSLSYFQPKTKIEDKPIVHLREAIINRQDAILKALFQDGGVEYSKALDVITDEIVADTVYNFGSVRKVLNIVLFTVVICNEFVTDDVQRERLYAKLEVPVDKLVYAYLKKGVASLDLSIHKFKIIEIGKDENHKYQAAALELVEASKAQNGKLKYRYDIDFEAWRPEQDEEQG